MRTLFVLILTICASLCALVIAAIHIGDEIVWERHFRKANIVDSCEYGIGKWNGSFEEAFANTPLTRKEKIPYRGADQVIKTGLGKFLYVVCQFPSETKFQILSTGPLFSKSQVRVDGVLQAEFDDFGEATLNIPPNQVNHHILEIISLGDQSEVVGPATLIPIYRTTDPNVHHAIQRFRLAPYGEHAAFRIGFTVSIILLLAFIWYFGIRYQDLFWLTVLTACATLENFSNYAYFLIPDWGPLLQRAEGLMVLATSSAIVFFLVSFLRFWKASWALQMIVGVALATFSIFVAISPANIFFNFKLQGQLQTYLAAGLILLLSGTLFYRLTSNSHNKLELKRVILVATIALVVGLLLLVQAVVQQQFGMYLSPYVQALIIVTFTCLAVGDLVRRQWEWLKERDKRLNLEKLNGSQRARIEVGSMLAHDLMGHIELLAMLPDDPTRDQILQAQAAGRQALGILENLNFLDSAIKIQPKPTPLHATILSAWQFVSWRNKKKAHNIKFSCIGASGVSLLFDPIGLYRICQNIIGNAFELMPVPGDISVTFERLEYGANVRFYNSGTYIDEVNWSTIFSRFWSSRSSKGLGLSIVKELVQAHGGQVSCESDKLNGTTFIINLPSSIVHSDASDANVGPMEYSFRIAIVDDDEIILAAWELAGAPGLVSTYRDPKEFLIDARAGALEEIDVVLLDLHFENASVQGLEVASKLNELYPNLPVLLTSILPVEHELTNIKGRIGKHPKHWHQILPNLVGAKF